MHGHCGWTQPYKVANQPRFQVLGFSSFATAYKLDMEANKFNKVHYIRMGSFTKRVGGKFSCSARMKQRFAKPRIAATMRSNLAMLIVGMVASVTINQASAAPAASPPFLAVVPSPGNLMTSVKAEKVSQSSRPSLDPAFVA